MCRGSWNIYLFFIPPLTHINDWYSYLRHNFQISFSHFRFVFDTFPPNSIFSTDNFLVVGRRGSHIIYNHYGNAIYRGTSKLSYIINAGQTRSPFPISCKINKRGDRKRKFRLELETSGAALRDFRQSILRFCFNKLISTRYQHPSLPVNTTELLI